MKPPRLQKSETKQQKKAYLQVGRYILKQFSFPAFRSHATVSLVDRGRIQFYHANHSVILVSSAINFTTSGGMEGLDKCLAIMIAFRHLSLRNDLHNGQLVGDSKKLATSEVRRGAIQIQEGNKLVVGGDKKTESFMLTYGKFISHEPSLAGRATLVFHAKSSSPEGNSTECPASESNSPITWLGWVVPKRQLMVANEVSIRQYTVDTLSLGSSQYIVTNCRIVPVARSIAQVNIHYTCVGN